MLYNSIVHRQPIDKGWSGDKKYCVTTTDGTKYLLRITSPEHAHRFHLGYLRMQEAAALDVSMCLPVEFGQCPEGTYAIHSWVEGVDAEEYIPTLPVEKQYAYGLDAGRILRKLHTLPAPTDATPWSERFNAKIDRKIRMYEEFPLKYKNGHLFLSFLADNRHLLSDRPQTYQHGDYHIGNMMINEDGVLTIIDFDRDDSGDPWYEFNRLIWDGRAAPEYARGMVDGYFDGEQIPDLFWRLMRLYLSQNMISSVVWARDLGETDLQIAIENAQLVLDWYDDLKEVVPNWYR